jgi:hypothetical protein
VTLIANSTNYSFPLMIGDLLMSSEEKNSEVQIPVFLKDVENRLPTNQKFFPFRLRQKIYVLTDNMCIGLAGLEFEMRLFLEDIKLYFKFHESSKKEIEKFYNEYDFSNFSGSSLLIMYAEKTKDGHLIHQITRGHWNYKESKMLEHLYTCGSGSKTFMEFSDYYGEFYESQNTPSLNRAISLNFAILCNILSVERITLETIKSYWGAGFETIYFDGNKFKKITDITFLICTGKVNLDDESYEIAPFIALNFRYHNEILVITSTDFKKVEGYAVLPLTMKKEDVDINQIPNITNFNSHTFCTTFVLEFSNGTVYSPSVFTENNINHPGFKIDFTSNGSSEIWINSEVEQKLVKDTIKIIKQKSSK